MRNIDEDILKAAVETYDLEAAFGINTDALRMALSASLAAFENKVMQRVAEGLFALSERLQGDTEPSWEGVAALEIAAREILAELPIQEEYVPETGDIVSIVLTGPVTVYEDDPCPNCGHESDKTTVWSILDRHSGQEFFFEIDDSVNARVISRGNPLSDPLA